METSENGGNGELASLRATQITKLDRVVVRFAGDSGDGMQLTGDRFTSEAAAFGNDLATLPNFPAEIRAPAGTLPGVSSFQIHFADYDILTPGDRPDVLVAMNPAALKANIADLPVGGSVIVNTDEFSKRNLTKVGYEANPLEDDSLSNFQVFEVPMATLTQGALKETGLSKKDAERSKNMFALGLLSWMYHRPTERTERFLREKFARKPEIAEANVLAFRAGWNYGETTESFTVTYDVPPAQFPPGTYRQITGNTALAYGLVAAGQCSGLPVLLGSYPITPASDILHELSRHKNFGITTMQAEDEIAGVGAALGAAYGGSLGVTTTSGPGIALKSETIGLAVMSELPLVVIDVQRGGPSTGLPTKTEQADLLQAMFGRNGESPVPIVAPQSPGDCFDAAIEATRIALKYRTPVLLLSDGAIANGSEPWLIPNVEDLPDLHVTFADGDQRARRQRRALALRPRHRDAGPRVGDPGHARAAAPDRRAGEGRRQGRHLLRPGQPRPHGPAPSGQSGRYRRAGPDRGRPDRRRAAARAGLGFELRPDRRGVPAGARAGPADRAGAPAAPEPVPRATSRDVLRSYDRVVIPEMNLGQLALLIRGRFLVDAVPYNKVAGLPFKAEELQHVLTEHLNQLEGVPA